jgi:hypothetical protein
MCQHDSWDPNHTMAAAMANPVMTPGTYSSLVSCPDTTSTYRGEDDWFRITVSSDQQVDLVLDGDGATDVDLHLYKPDNTQVAYSISTSPHEEIHQCLTAGTYYIKVNAYGYARSVYTLQYNSHAQTCAAVCTPTNDGSQSTSRTTSYPTFTSPSEHICSDHDDWYHVPLYTAEQLTVDLTFVQSNYQQDLDVHLYTGGTDLWPCDVGNPMNNCQVAHGQGSVSNEHATYLTPLGCSPCDYYVVVHGYNHSANTYGITIGIQ